MLVGAVIAAFLIVGLFFEMIASSPKKDPEWHSDTERERTAH